MPRKHKPGKLHYVQHIGTSGRGRAACGLVTSEATNETDRVDCQVCLKALERALIKREPGPLVDDIIAEVRRGWGDEAVNRGAVLTILLERIIARQLTESGLILKLTAIDRELSNRGL